MAPCGPQVRSLDAQVKQAEGARERRPLVGARGIEPLTPTVSRWCSPAELRALGASVYREASPQASEALARKVLRHGDRRPEAVLSSRAMDLPVRPDTSNAVETAAYAVLMPEPQRAPLVFASPHSGRRYPPQFLAAARLDAHALRRSEDSFVEELFESAPRHGCPLIHALFPRVWCDPNREPWELDPEMFDSELPAWVNAASPRVGAGLGTIARIVATGEPIYRRKLSFAEAEERIATCWRPYHEALAGLIAATRERFGLCLLIDCHSMPTLTAQGPLRPPEIILGDAHGTSASPSAVRRLEEAFLEAGFSVRRNDPYAGGYVTRHYGRPHHGVHAVQIEIARTLYMDEERIVRHGGFDALRDRLERVIATLATADWAMLERG